MTRPAMIRMAIAQNIPDHDLGLVFANRFNDLELVGLIIAEKSISHSQVLPDRRADDHRRIGRLLVACLDGPTRAEFALREVDDPYLFSPFYFIDQRAGAAEFYIVRMNADGEDV